jgi:hypothetical protein
MILTMLALATAIQRTPATEEERSAAMETYFACLAKAADENDDNRSDAMTIGLIIAPYCRSGRELVAQVWTREYKRDRVRVWFLQDLEDRAPQDAAAMVVARRQARGVN